MHGPTKAVAALKLALALWLLTWRASGANIAIYQGASGSGWAHNGVAGGYLQPYPSGNSFFWSDSLSGHGWRAWNGFFYGFNPNYFAYYPIPAEERYALGSPAEVRDVSAVQMAFRTYGKLVGYPDGQAVILYPAQGPQAGSSILFRRPPAIATPAPFRPGVTILLSPSYPGARPTHLVARPEMRTVIPSGPDPMPARDTTSRAGAKTIVTVRHSAQLMTQSPRGPNQARAAVLRPAYLLNPPAPEKNKP